MSEIKILVVFTGGTIASESKHGVRDLSAMYNTILECYKSRHGETITSKGITFDETKLNPTTLSESMTVGKWNQLIEVMRAEKLSEYSGIIITHGTDTLAYTASLFSVLLSHIKKPVVFVSSNAPLSSPSANGHKNFEDAVSFICGEHQHIRGTVVAYSYDLRRTEIYLASRMKQAQPFINRYESLDGHDFGYMENGKFFMRGEAAHLSEGNIVNATEAIFNTIRLENCVLLIAPYVGLDYSRFDLSGVKAVLQGTYHSYTCAAGDGLDSNASAEWFCKKCLDQGIQFYCAPFGSDIEPYGSTKRMEEAGARFIKDSSMELAYAKLTVAYSYFSSHKDIEDFLKA